jgi:hypothetical protein
VWYYNRLVELVYAHVNTKYGMAVIEGVSGWKKIAPVSADGVTNVLDVLKVSKANGRRVHVYMGTDGQIYSAIML